MRRFIRIATFIVLGLFFVLCVGTSFIGAEAARQVVNSTPAVIFWGGLFVVLCLSLVFFPRLRRSPVLLAIHGGTLLVLFGAMYGSPIAHDLWATYLGSKQVDSGYLYLREGWGSHTVLGQDLQTELAKLPFQVTLEDFTIERYPPPDPRWDLVMTAPTLPGEARQGRNPHQEVKWKQGQEVALPQTDIRVTVEEYIPAARPEYPDDARRRLVIDRNDGDQRSLPAEQGQELSLDDPEVTLRVERVFENLQVRTRDGQRQVVDADGEGRNPALELSITRPDGSSQTTYLMPEFPSHGQDLEGIDLRYALPQPEGAVPDSESDTPAARVVVQRGDRKTKSWLMPREGANRAVLDLNELFPDHSSSGGGASPHGMDGTGQQANSRLFMLKPRGQAKSYRSDVVILEEGEEVRRKAVEVNDPLHYGGYHFYQHSYREGPPPATILQVVSDAGLWAVYAGFVLLVAGVIGWCWVKPLARNTKEES